MDSYDVFLVSTDTLVGYDTNGRLVSKDRDSYRRNHLMGTLRHTREAAEQYAAKQTANYREAFKYVVFPVTVVVPEGSVFVLKVNVDRTEGRGGLKDFARFDNLPAAIEAGIGEGVMGVGDAEIFLAGDPAKVNVFSTVEQWRARRDFVEAVIEDAELFNSYRGLSLAYVSNDASAALIEDPEFQKYLELQNRFGSLR